MHPERGKRERVKIAIHVGSRIWGGAERASARLAAGLQARGHEVRLFCNQHEHVARAGELGLRAVIAPLHGDVALHTALAFAVRLRGYRPDVLIVGTYKKLWLAGLAARLARVPRVVARVGLDSDVPRNRKYRFALRHLVSTVVVNSRAQAAPFLALPGRDAHRVRVIYNYYEPRPHGSPDRIRRELGLTRELPVVGAVARLATQKRLERLLDAVALLPGVHCVLAGDGPRAPELHAHAAVRDITGRVHFLGHRDDIPDVLALLDVFVICSDREGMSNAMLEALAAGVPVVSTPVSGATDALEPLADGTSPGTIAGPQPEAIAAAVGRILADHELRASMKRAAATRIAERFAPESVLCAWEQVLAEPRAASRAPSGSAPSVS